MAPPFQALSDVTEYHRSYRTVSIEEKKYARIFGGFFSARRSTLQMIFPSVVRARPSVYARLSPQSKSFLFRFIELTLSDKIYADILIDKKLRTIY